jgi:hypothetical protein
MEMQTPAGRRASKWLLLLASVGLLVLGLQQVIQQPVGKPAATNGKRQNQEVNWVILADVWARRSDEIDRQIQRKEWDAARSAVDVALRDLQGFLDSPSRTQAAVAAAERLNRQKATILKGLEDRAAK